MGKRQVAGSSLSSASRAKRQKPKSDTESEASESSDDSVGSPAVFEKTLRKDAERDRLAKTAESAERENAALLERIKKAAEERRRLNDRLRHELNSVPDQPEQELQALPQTPPTSAKVKVPLDSPNLHLYPSAWIYESCKATYKLNRMRAICKILLRHPHIDTFRTLANLLMCDNDESYFAEEERSIFGCPDSEDEIEYVQPQVPLSLSLDRISTILHKIDSRGPNTSIAKMFLPWMIAAHGFSYGGAEYRDSAEAILFHILKTDAVKFDLVPDDVDYFRYHGGNAWNTFVKQRQNNSGACFFNSHVNLL
jgi:hypothetical protein